MGLFDTTFGQLIASVALDDPQRLYSGTAIPITGFLTVEFVPKTPDVQELFGPCEISIFLEGFARTSIEYKNMDGDTRTHKGTSALIAQRVIVLNGPLKIAAGRQQRLPFSIRFPERTQVLSRDAYNVAEDHLFNMTPDGPLPPSTYGMWGSSMHRNTDGWVEYRVRSGVVMPGVNIRCLSQGEEHGGHLVHYEQPPVPVGIMDRQRIGPILQALVVSNENLLPEHARPKGFREKLKAFFDSNAYPTFAASVSIDGPVDLLLGPGLAFDLRIQPETQLTTVSELPQIELGQFLIHIYGETQVRAVAMSSRERYQKRRVKLLTLAAGTKDPRPWSKANDFTKTMVSTTLSQLPSTFSTFNITRTYSVDIESGVVIAGKEKKLKFKNIPVRVLPPEPAATMAGPSINHAVLPYYHQPPLERGQLSGQDLPPDYVPATTPNAGSAVVQTGKQKA